MAADPWSWDALPGVDTGTHCTANVLPAGVAHTIAQVLRGDVESDLGTATRADIPGHEIAGKTGTSQNNFSVAFMPTCVSHLRQPGQRTNRERSDERGGTCGDRDTGQHESKLAHDGSR